MTETGPIKIALHRGGVKTRSNVETDLGNLHQFRKQPLMSAVIDNCRCQSSHGLGWMSPRADLPTILVDARDFGRTFQQLGASGFR